MAKYDGLIIPRSYSEYINKTDAATHQQAHQVNGVLDDTPTDDSPKAVKSGGVYDALAGKQPTLTFDNVPTEDSNNPVTSDGIYDALGGRSGLTWDSAPTEDSVNPVESGGVFDALATKQDTLTFDDTPTASSNNPVKSGGIKSYTDGLFPDYSQVIQSGITSAGFTASEDCYLNVSYISIRTNQDITCELKINGNTVVENDYSAISATQKRNVLSWSGLIKKGSTVYWYLNGAISSTQGFKFFKLSR